MDPEFASDSLEKMVKNAAQNAKSSVSSVVHTISTETQELQKKAAQGDADFSGISPYKVKIDRVIQETVIDLNKTGVEAAGYTEILAAPGEAAPDGEPEKLPFVEFHLDRPFLFVIEGAGGTPLFVGTVAALQRKRCRFCRFYVLVRLCFGDRCAMI